MSFDSLARHYRWMEIVLAGNKLQLCRTAFLREIHSAVNVLIVGEGNGRFLAECRRALPAARVTVVDSSKGMLSAAQRRMEKQSDAASIQFVHADARVWTPPREAFDLIVTHFFLDCFPSDQLERVIANLAQAATSSAMWLLADFQIPENGLARLRARIIHALMYAFFRVAVKLPARELIQPDGLLRRHGFELDQRKTSEWELLHSDLWRRVDQ